MHTYPLVLIYRRSSATMCSNTLVLQLRACHEQAAGRTQDAKSDGEGDGESSTTEICYIVTYTNRLCFTFTSQFYLNKSHYY